MARSMTTLVLVIQVQCRDGLDRPYTFAALLSHTSRADDEAEAIAQAKGKHHASEQRGVGTSTPEIGLQRAHTNRSRRGRGGDEAGSRRSRRNFGESTNNFSAIRVMKLG